MANNSWSYNPLNLFSSFGHLFTNEGKTTNYDNNVIKKPSKLEIQNMSLIIFNMNGVLRLGKTPIPIVKESVNNFIKEDSTKFNIPLCILTNDCRRSPKIIKKELKNMGYKINNDIKIITASLLTLKHLTLIIKKHPKIKNNTNQIIKIGLVCESDFFYYIKNNFRLSYVNNIHSNKIYNKKVKFYWIQDNINPQNLDYLVFSCLKDNEKYCGLEKRIVNWIINSPSAAFLLTSTNKQNTFNDDKNQPIYKMPLELFDNTTTNAIKLNNKLKTELNLKYYSPSMPNTTLIKSILEEDYGIEFQEDNKKILIISDNLERNQEFTDNLKCSNCLVLTGQTKYNQIKSMEKKILDKINYIVPDASYCLM